MNNKEKREYISCLHLRDNINLCSPEERLRVNEVLQKCPSSFFKYKAFNEHSFEMIEEKYLYLAPVEFLDDPFDCLSDFGTSQIANKGEINDRFVEYIYKQTPFKTDRKSLAFVKKYKDALKYDCLDERILRKAVIEEGMVPDYQVDLAVNNLKNLANYLRSYDEDKTIETFGRVLMDPGKRVGICSLSEINDNKVMWSLYGKEYEGYCVEYTIRNTKKGRRFLLPVIYSRKPNNSFAEKMFDSIFAELNRQILEKTNPWDLNSMTPNVGAIYELFCSKDIDWRFQKEWRIIGDPKEHFKEIDIKAVYLGFKVSEVNEEKMIRCAKDKGFELYKMKVPNGKKNIEYLKLI